MTSKLHLLPARARRTRTRAEVRAQAQADATLLRSAIALSGLTNGDFAARVLVRDVRTVQRWLTGRSELPDAAREYLSEYVSYHPKTKRKKAP